MFPVFKLQDIPFIKGQLILKANLKFSFEPKNQRKYFCISSRLTEFQHCTFIWETFFSLLSGKKRTTYKSSTFTAAVLIDRGSQQMTRACPQRFHICRVKCTSSQEPLQIRYEYLIFCIFLKYLGSSRHHPTFIKLIEIKLINIRTWVFF